MRAGEYLPRVQGENPTGKEARLSQRYRVLFNAELVTTTDEQAVKVRDISIGGAMLEGQREIAKGRDVILRRGTIELFAQIRWTSGHECGVGFDDALTEAEMFAFLREPVKGASILPDPFKSSFNIGMATLADTCLGEARITHRE